MPNFGAGNSLTLFLFGDASGLNKTLKQTQRNVTTFSKDVERASSRAQASTAASAGFAGGAFGRGSKFNQGLRGVASGTGLGSAALFGSGAFIGAALGAGALKASVDAASDLNEQITKSQQVFGDSAKVILDWSKTTSKSIFISREAALEAASTFGNLFKAQGFGDIQNSNLSRGLVQLAGDLASFNNIDVKQVLEDLQSGIVGEIEPVRKYGADLRIARVQQEALAETGKTVVKSLTAQELTLARLKLLYKDTKSAQGDAARTAGGLANQERKLQAQTQDLAAKVGTLLLPAAGDLVKTLNNVADIAGLAADGLNKIANVKIPPIRIPLIFDSGGGGTTVGKIFDKATLTLGEFVELTDKQINKTIDDFRKAPPPNIDTSKLASSFQKRFSPFFQSALNQSVRLKGFFTPFQGKNAKNAFGGLIDSLNLNLDRSDLTATSSDNIAILRQLLIAYKEEIKAGVDVKNAQKNLIATKKDLQQAIKEAASTKFSNISDSLQLGVEKSEINGSLSSQLAALGALKAGLLKQIKAGVDVRSAQHQLASVEGSIASLQNQIKEEGIAKVVASLQLGVDRAALTKGLGDDLKALEAQRDGLKAQIRAGNDVENNQSQLVTVLGNIAAKQQEIAQAGQDAQKARLFKQIGLSSTGGEIIPGVGNLKKQFAELQKNLPDVQSTTLRKLTDRLAGVGKALASPFLKAQPEVRSAIKELFGAIRDELSNQSTNGPLTKTTSLNTNKILKGLGLDAASAKELKARLSKFNSAGVGLSAGVAASASGVAFGAGAPNVVVNVELDGQKVAKSVTVHQQKRARSNPPQKRGPIGGRI